MTVVFLCALDGGLLPKLEKSREKGRGSEEINERKERNRKVKF